MKKIIHITDTHCKKGKIEQRFRILIQKIINTFKKSQDYIVILTGDIVDEANNKNYSLAYKYLNKLRDAGFQLLCCPGNRDYGTSSLGNKKFIAAFEDTFLNDDTGYFPTKTIYKNDKKNIAFIGLESMVRELNWTKNTSMDGEIGNQQLKRLESLLKETDVIKAGFLAVYLHHSPFSTDNQYQLKDRLQLKKILMSSQKSVDLMLFGHKHDGVCWHGHWGIPMIYGGGSSTLVDNSPCVFRVIELEKNISDQSFKDDDFINEYIATLKEKT